MLRIRVLGELAVDIEGQRLDPPAAWRARSLLAWLALHPGSHPRAELAPRFWPDVLDESARASLRNALWALRRDLGGEHIASTRERVSLADGAWVDARAFEELAAAGREEEALALCRGELLAGFDDEWVLEARDAHREQLAELHARLAARAEADGDLEEAVRHTRAHAALDPLAEEPVRELVRRLAGAGDLPAALTSYDRFRDRLRTELGIVPSAATRRLVEELRTGAVAEPADAAAGALRAASDALPAAPGRPPAPWLGAAPPGPFVGRERELRPLRAALERAMAGDGAELLLLAGEPGIGKTRLAAELARDAAAGGALVLHGRCDEDPLAPYQSFVEAIGGWAAAASADELRRCRSPELARIVPELGRRVPAAEGAPPSRYALFEAVAGLLAGLSAAAPVVLLLDDLHWADQPSLKLLRHVVLRARPARLLVLGAYRDAELRPDHPLPQVLADIRRDIAFERLTIEGLGEDEVAALVGALRPDAAEAGVAGKLHATTRGNPFFVHELLRELGEPGGPPEGVREVVRARIARLGEDCTRLLQALAVLARPAELPVLERVSGLAVEQLVDAAEAAEAARLVEERGGRHALAHAIIREAVYADLAAARRVQLHGRAADALQALHAGDARPPLAELGRHCAESGRPELAVEHLTRAGEAASEQFAYEQAVLHYTRARRLLRPDDSRRRGLAVRRGVAFQALSHAMLYDAEGRVRAAYLSDEAREA